MPTQELEGDGKQGQKRLTTLRLTIYHAVVSRILAPYMRREKAKRPEINERRDEYVFALDQLAGCRTVLDVGTGRSPWPALLTTAGMDVTAIDAMDDYWQKRGGFFNHHYPVEHHDIRERIDGHYDAVTCISTLEHIEQWEKALQNMKSCAGRVILTVPVGDRYRILEDQVLTQVFTPSMIGQEPEKVVAAPHGRFDVGCFTLVGTDS